MSKRSKQTEISVVLGISEILNELMDSSSSSEDEIEAVLLPIDSQPCVEDFIGNVVHSYTAAEFKEKFHINRESAEYLIKKYSNCSWYGERSYKGGRRQTTAEAHILSFLWFSARKATYREVVNLFGLTLSNIHTTFNKVLNFLAVDVVPEVIKFPQNEEDKKTIARELESIAGFPNVLGCIDDCAITTRRPKDKMHSKFTKRHDGVAITLQAICDANMSFLIIQTSTASNNLKISKLKLLSTELTSACAPQYYLLGDIGYLLREYLLTPFEDDEDLSEAENVYNEKFYQTHVKIENAFVMLKSRFRQLMRLDFHNIETMNKFIMACCALHNICIDHNDYYELEANNKDNKEIDKVTIAANDEVDAQLTSLGQLKRIEVKTNFIKNT